MVSQGMGAPARSHPRTRQYDRARVRHSARGDAASPDRSLSARRRRIHRRGDRHRRRRVFAAGPQHRRVLAKAAELPWKTTRNIIALAAKRYRCSMTDVDKPMAPFQRLRPTTAQQILDFHRTRKRPSSRALGLGRSLGDQQHRHQPALLDRAHRIGLPLRHVGAHDGSRADIVGRACAGPAHLAAACDTAKANVTQILQNLFDRPRKLYEASDAQGTG